MAERDLRYLNNAGTSWPKAPRCAETVAEVMGADPRTYGALFEQARADVAGCLGISTPSELLLTPGCTSALATAMRRIRWAAGDAVLTSAVEHEAVLGPIGDLVRNVGIEHRRVPYRRGDAFDLERCEEMLSDGNVRWVVVTAASNVTGECLPVAEIVGLARRHGARVLLDGAQVVGLLPLNFESLGVDAVAFAGHKGPLAPLGVGGLWLGETSSLDIGFCDLGSVDLPSAVVMGRALQWLASDAAPPPGFAISLRNELQAALVGRRGCHVLGAEGPSTGVLSVCFDALPVDKAEALFAEHGIVVRAGRHCAASATAMLGAPEGTVRFSFGRLNRPDDVDAVMRVVATL
ncbi:MAG: aminotransferase class V-fold PLP-dependent enzyme [Nannocystaceae bacterium]|nr:aminotransferase class V-fold PLP-dependent enzyme [Nannocystaceae bacterium]